MSQSSKTYQPTSEQIAKWKRIDELESSCATGFLSPEEQDKNVEKFFEKDYVDSQLEKVRAHKEKLLKKLQSAEEYEQLLLEEKHKRG
ncbi:MAG: hypothetical protein AAGG00_19895 [Cyanobacteria bacterium P01_H01_bin.150]